MCLNPPIPPQSLQQYNLSQSMLGLIVFTKPPYALFCWRLGCSHSLVQLHLYALVRWTGATVTVYSLHASRQMDRHENANPCSHGGCCALISKIRSQPCKTLTRCQPEVILGNWGTASQLLIITLHVHHTEREQWKYSCVQCWNCLTN